MLPKAKRREASLTLRRLTDVKWSSLYRMQLFKALITVLKRLEYAGIFVPIGPISLLLHLSDPRAT